MAFREDQNDTEHVRSQVFNADGAERSSQVGFFGNPGSEANNPQLVGLPDGGFLVISEHVFFTQNDRALVQRFDADGNKIGTILLAAADSRLEEPTATLLENGIVALTFQEGGALATRLLVTERDDVIGDETDNTFIATAAPENFVGGEGFDTVDYSAGTSGIRNGSRSAGDALGDVFDGIEKIIGTDFDDRFDRFYELNEIIAGAGNDTVSFDARRSIDNVVQVDLGDGNDLLQMHFSSDDNQAVFNQSSFLGGAGVDRLRITGSGDMDFRGTTLSGVEELTMNGNVECFHFNFMAEQFQDFTYVDTSRRGDLLVEIDMGDLTNLDLSTLNTDDGNRSPIDFRINGNDDAETIKGSNRSDEVFGGLGNDDLRGFIGADSVFGGEGDDEVHGGDGDDSLFGDLGNDLMFGGAADDTLFGSFGVDTMFGGDGADIFDGGFEVDHLFGGADTDTLDLSTLKFNSLQSVVMNLQDETYFAVGSLASAQSIVNVENVIGSAFGDEITGNAVENTLDGGLGDDTVDGGEGDDNVLGKGGDDTMLGNGGVDRFSGYGGNDFLRGDDGDDRLFGGAGNDLIRGGAGADLMSGGAGDMDVVSYASDTAGVSINLNTGSASGGEATGDTILFFEGVIGGSGDDVLIGSAADNGLFGGNGNDILLGGSGNDILDGGAGDDTILGSAGDDTINGGDGADVLTGGGGVDILIFVDGDAGTDVITDFDIGVDVIQFLDAASGTPLFSRWGTTRSSATAPVGR